MIRIVYTDVGGARPNRGHAGTGKVGPADVSGWELRADGRVHLGHRAQLQKRLLRSLAGRSIR